MRVTYIVAIFFALVATARPGSNESAETLPKRYPEDLKARLPSDADQLISVLRARRTPHTIAPTAGLTVSKAIERAGGFPDFAARRQTRVWKLKEGRYVTVDVKNVLDKKPGAEDPLLDAGDVVIVVMHPWE